MKKILLSATLFFCFICFFTAAGCAEDRTYTVTFRQEGYEDILYTVPSGGSIDQLPEPNGKIGYEVVWDRTDFSDIEGDLLVTAVASPKTYSVTFNLLGGVLQGENGSVLPNSGYSYTYGEEYAFPSAFRDGYTFSGWVAWKMREPDQQISLIYSAVEESGTWNICNETDGVCSVTIYATWSYDIVFRQQGYEDIVLTYTETPNGSTSISEEDIPLPHGETGYSVTWESFRLSELKGNTVIEAIKQPRKYRVYYETEAGVLMPAGTAFDESRQQYYSEFVFGESFTLPVPEKAGSVFEGWTYRGETLENGVWDIAESVTLTPVFSAA